MNYVSGSLSGTLAGELEAARAPLKALRNEEVAINQKRNVRAGIHNQIGRLEHSQEKGYEKHIAELKAQLAKAETDDEPAETAYKILLRKSLKESEQKKFQALREVGGLIIPIFKSLSSFPFRFSMVRSSPFSPRQPMLFLLFCHLSLHHRIGPT